MTEEVVLKKLQQSKRGKLPIVNANGELVALATRAIFKENARSPKGGAPSIAPDGRLLVGAAVGTRDSDKERVKVLRYVSGYYINILLVLYRLKFPYTV